MKFLIALSLLVATASAGILPRMPLVPLMPMAELEGRITNGEVAARGQFKYQVGLSLVFGDSGAWCGGTLVSDRWIITAAHCTDGADEVTVYLGANNIGDSNEVGQQRIYSDKSNIVIHPGWNPSTFANDISMIKLPVAVTFNEYIQPATLPKLTGEYSTYVGDMVWASGWGKDDDEDTSVSEVLRFIEVSVIDKSTCNLYYFGLITDSMICICGSGGKSVSEDDSGGPLVYKDGDSNILIGATSFGIALGDEYSLPSVFTRITAYLDWIKSTSGVVNE